VKAPIALALALAACWRDPVPSSTTSTTSLDDLAWLAGTWHSRELDAHWARAGRALYGVAMTPATLEINTITDRAPDGRAQPMTLTTASWTWAKPAEIDRMAFELTSASPTRIELTDRRDRVVIVTRNARGWRGEFREPGRMPVSFTMVPGTLQPAPPNLPEIELPMLGAMGVVDAPVAVARRGDTVFAIGTTRAIYYNGGSARFRRGSYWRAWHRDGDRWRVVGGERRLEE
jgi:hypothetical protein